MATMKEFARRLNDKGIRYLRSSKSSSFCIVKKDDYRKVTIVLETIPYYTIRKLLPSQLDQLVDKLLILYLFS